MDLNEIREKLREVYGGENRQITDGNYDQSLAVKCINGTFVGRKTENITVFRGIPYVGKQPVGELRWKAPVTMRKVPTAMDNWKQVPFTTWMKTAYI